MVSCLHMHKFLTLWTSIDKLSKQKASDWNLYEKGGLQGQTDPLMGLRLSLLLRSQQSKLWQELASEQIVFVLCYPSKGKSCDMNGTMAVNVHCPSKTNCTFQRETPRQRYWRVSRIFFWSPNYIEHSSSICLQTYMKFPCIVHPLSALLYCVYHD